jgi:hypothetical protein
MRATRRVPAAPRGAACRACADTAQTRRRHGADTAHARPKGGPPAAAASAGRHARPHRRLTVVPRRRRHHRKTRSQTLGRGPRRSGREAGEDRLHQGLRRPRQGVGGDGDGDVPGGPAGTKVDHREPACLLACDGCGNDHHAEAAHEQVEQRVDVVDLRGDLAGRAPSCEGSLLTRDEENPVPDKFEIITAEQARPWAVSALSADLRSSVPVRSRGRDKSPP